MQISAKNIFPILSNMTSIKSQIRKNILHKRKEQSFEDNKTKSHIICHFLLQNIQKSLPQGGRILLYAPRQSEVDIFPLFEMLKQESTVEYHCLFPKITDERACALEAVQVRNRDSFTDHGNSFGIQESSNTDYEDPTSLDLVLVPSIAIDTQGNRIGHGKGFYDRFLKRILPTCYKWAPVFFFQRVEKIPVDSYDVPVGAIIDETGFFSHL